MRRTFTLPETLVMLAVVLFGGVWLWSAFLRPKPSRARNSTCRANLMQMSLGMMQYVQDYDERYPPARGTASLGWAQALQPYVKSWGMFQCPVAAKSSGLPSPVPAMSSDYFYNRRLAREVVERLKSPNSTIWAGDGINDAPSWSSALQLPADAETNTDSPAQRHIRTTFNGANYAFVDGHFKWLSPRVIANKMSTTGTFEPTFALR